ncbi:MAG: 4a-hydroxytetrahydrobiopterin dehydratase [Ignavibacteriaceae bacterium]
MNKLSAELINERLKNYTSWNFSGNMLSKEFILKDFKSVLDFVNKIGEAAEQLNHHPDMFIHSWNKLKVSVTTHSEGGVTEKDFTLIDRIEKHQH